VRGNEPNEDGRSSKLRNLTIEAYHHEKAQLHERQTKG